MIELQKRYNTYKRRLPLMVIDMFNDQNTSESVEYIIKIFGKEGYLKICKEINTIYHWLIIDEHNKKYYIVATWDNVMKMCCNYSMFNEKDKSSFKYWFAHWCSFQLTALNLGIWKIKYLFHDFEKPWLKLFLEYKKVQKWHREHNKHHLEYGLKHGWDKVDWTALMIDWQCSYMSKKQCPLNCREEMERIIKTEKWNPYENIIRFYLESLLDSYYL